MVIKLINNRRPIPGRKRAYERLRELKVPGLKKGKMRGLKGEERVYPL